ncbi:MAG: GNAT family N-acetyltransferase [Paracoccaceae bacterium]
MSDDLQQAVLAAASATWPPHWTLRQGPFLFRDGAGGGKRVSAASAVEPVAEDDIALAEVAFRNRGECPSFLIGDGQADRDLDDLLAARGYALVDPVITLAAPLPLDPLSDAGVQVHTIWPATPAMRAFWAKQRIGPARLAVMARAALPKAVLAVRKHGRIAGLGFVGLHGKVAMLHALAVAEAFRRQGIARALAGNAARWAQDNGATTLALLVTAENSPALSLYAGLSFRPVGRYHYRQYQKPEGRPCS